MSLPTKHNSPSRTGLVVRSLAVWLSAVALAAVSGTAMAINASPHSFELEQPDGTKIELHVRGDEHYHWLEDFEGYTVVRDPSSREFRYARRNPDGRLAPGPHRVGRDNPREQGLSRRLKPSAERLEERRLENRRSPQSRRGVAKRGGPQLADGDETGGTTLPEAVPAAGTVKNLVILIRFSDHTGRTLPSQGDVNTLFNAVGGHPSLAPTGSIRDVYYENSYGQMTLESTVSLWVTLPNTEAYYADGSSGLVTQIWEAIEEGLDGVNGSIDFGDFDTDNDGWIDSIAFIHSGYGAEWGGSGSDDRIWSHRWSIPTWSSGDTNGNGVSVKVSDYHISPGLWGTSGSSIGRIGVIAHETGHFFGLPDLYDTVGTGNGIGSYGMMANSWGFDGSQRYPPHFTPWSKIDLGWLTPTVLDTPGNYDIPRVQDNPTVFRINQGYPSGEYLLIENRQDWGFDAQMPQGGLAIYHIDDTTGFNTEGYPGQSGWPGNGNHYRVALLQADGDYDLERQNNRGDSGDVYHGGGGGVDRIAADTLPDTDAYQNGNIIVTNNEISNISNSAASMQFTYGLSIAPANITSTPNLTATVGQSYLYDCDATVEATGTPTITFSLTSTGPTGFNVSPAGLVSWIPTSTGTFPVEITANNAALVPDTQNFNIIVSPASSPVPFSDDFETDKCWVPDPDGTDGATTGHWERANPQGTTDQGFDVQLGNAHGGSFDLVTEGDAGTTAGSHDIDNGVTSIRSPSFVVPASYVTAQLEFWYYFFHANNSSTADFMRVTVEGTSGSQVILDEQGDNSTREAVWTEFTVNLNAFIGDTITLLVEAADNGGPSLVEGAIDDIVLSGSATPPTNTAPEVEAGGPHLINFSETNQVNLNGTVSDDALPAPPNLTTEWTVTGGNPGNVSFGNDANIDTTATFAASGVYTLTLEADDGALQTSDSVAVTVNASPSVEAGGNQIITLPTNSVNLNSTVTDDGLPTPTNLDTEWTVISGNGAGVVFGNTGLQDTGVTFPAADTYTLRITADDGGGQTVLPFDNMTVIVNPAPVVNVPPTVSILTGDQEITLPGVDSVAIDGNVTDDDLPEPVSLVISWSVFSGDASKVSFNPSNAADTTATFTAPGTYVLRLTANDGAESQTADVTVTVNGTSQEDTAALLVPILDLLLDEEPAPPPP